MPVPTKVMGALAVAAALLSACTAPPDAPTAVFVGDSFTEGYALSTADADERWPSLLAQELGWEEINAGCAGAGYTRQGAVCTTTFREQLPTHIEADPDIIVLSGGLNDLASTPEHIRAAVRATYLSVRETYPDATIYAVSGVAPNATAASALTTVNDAVAAAASEIGAVFVDIGEPLQDRPDLLAIDGFHPNAAGHHVIAELTSNVIAGD
ncbi:SGNH/GDSL hydrolase family protein [Demequina globuliformis]|uniref:SGNH/GDSL hydrolase family protein n=1 Tax=Demequina globuliformis TaxID=676202 RepID=UPI000B274028|nr:SGNH/GDSL hydrolase family protein [Demequina globuliformis]